MMNVWRIGYCENPAPGKLKLLAELGYGSRLTNGRWHTKGSIELVYTGSSRALCYAEKLVHCNGVQPAKQALMRLEIPDDATILDVRDLGLPADWRDNQAKTQAMGMEWLASRESLGLWVPSFVVEGDFNLLINPAHPEYKRISVHIEANPLVFDPRLFAGT